MGKAIVILFAAAFVAAGADAANPVIAAPVKRTVRPTVTFEEVLKNIAVEIVACRRLHGAMTRIASATLQGGMLDIKGEANPASIDKYPMKAAPTPEQLKSLVGKPICDPN